MDIYRQFRYQPFQKFPAQLRMHTLRAATITLSVALVLLLLTVNTISSLAQSGSSQSQLDENGQTYVVQSGDSLSSIARLYYGDDNAWRIIVEATNARAAEETQYTPITDPALIRVGQRLWLPNVSGAASSPSNPPTTTEPSPQPTATVPPPSTPVAETETPAPAQASPTIVATTSSTTDASADDSPQVLFISPTSGATISETTTITMAALGLTVEAAGKIRPDAGHLHILVDTEFIPANELIIEDGHHLHFGQGELATTLTLEPGEHTLRLQFTNGAHIALEGDQYRDEINVTVAGPTDAGSGAVRFLSPGDGETVASSFEVAMEAIGLEIEQAGKIRDGAGHFHLLVDTDFAPAGELMIQDAQHIDLAQGELTVPLELTPGEHILRLQFVNGAHIALEGPQYRDEIRVTVEE